MCKHTRSDAGTEKPQDSFSRPCEAYLHTKIGMVWSGVVVRGPAAVVDQIRHAIDNFRSSIGQL